MFDLETADIEADWWRFYRIWIDLESGEFGNLSAQRWIEMTERLVAYDGVLTARMNHLLEEQKKRNPSADTLAKGGTEVTVLDGSTASLSDPALAGIVEVVQV